VAAQGDRAGRPQAAAVPRHEERLIGAQWCDWQETFTVILAVLNIDPEASKKVSTAENGRIK
jgi:hypothetical protein